MYTFKRIIKSTLFVGGSVLIALGAPLAAFADTAPTTTTDSATTTPSSATTPQADTSSVPSTAPTPTTTTTDDTIASTPTSADTSSMPTTQPTPPKTTYTYDSVTGHWNSNSWTYDPLSGTYAKTVTPVPVPASTATTSAPAQSTVDSATTTAIANALNASAASGDASVLKNTSAGNATTGDASSAATIVNNVNSSLSNSTNQQAASFVTNVMGDVNGDILLQPMLLKAMLEANAQTPQTSETVNSATTTGVKNDLTLGASSGNATVSGNTSAGNATSGSANTVANVVNIVNSMVAANQSFIGTVNIYGNLNGDILIAPDFIPQLLASNAGTSTIPAPVGTASITSNDTQSIVNNIALAAQTGKSLVSGNTSAGSATSGTANTNAVIFNLTGHDIVASNSLLVFVNVLGSWVGVIVDAPTGATAAAIGSGVTSNSVTPNLVIDATNNTLLTNNINLTSQTGDASVIGNTSAGNARSGNATASTNIANISNSEISTGGWFGILFINVFGNWFGSFGVDTAAGNSPTLPGQTQGTASSGSSSANPPHVMDFIPHSSARPTATVVQGTTTSTTAPTGTMTGVLGASQTTPKHTNLPAPATSVAPIQAFDWPLLVGSIVVLGGSLFGLRKLS